MEYQIKQPTPLQITYKAVGRTLQVALTGGLTVGVSQKIWQPVYLHLNNGIASAVVDLGGLTELDLDGAAQIFTFCEQVKQKGATVEVTNTPANFQVIYKLAMDALSRPGAKSARRPSQLELLGKSLVELKDDFNQLMIFTGQVVVNCWYFITHPHRMKWKQILNQAEVAGVNAMPVISLVAFLVGLIMAFQAAMPLKMFGVEVYVADLIGLSVTRELAPLMAAIVLAGRTGSAFSAELGAMKAGQEIDAIVTMGLDPVRELVMPRVMATVLVTPMITVLASLIGLIGGNIVLISLGYPISVFWRQVMGIVTLSDIFSGLSKSVVFGLTVATIGCQRGLAVSEGPSAVGWATTSGVVTNIVLIAVLDGIFAVVFYVLGF